MILTEKEVKLIEKVFFLAMNAGYATDVVPRLIREMPWMRAIPFEHNEDGHHFLVIDSWSISPDSTFSFGSTVIVRDGIPVWYMTYNGRYSEEVISFLRKALEANYSSFEFYGGRGSFIYPRERNPGGYRYFNQVTMGSSFRGFSGKEEIVFNDSGILLGNHSYEGNLMFPVAE